MGVEHIKAMVDKLIDADKTPNTYKKALHEINNQYKKGLLTDSEHRLAIIYMMESRLSTLGLNGC